MKIASAVLILALAGILYLARSQGDEPLPDTTESETQWMCHACQHAFRLTARKAEAEEKRAGGPAPLICPSCGQKQAWRAATCSVCSTMYFGAEVPGCTGGCPKCYPKLRPIHGPGSPDEPLSGNADGQADEDLPRPARSKAPPAL